MRLMLWIAGLWPGFVQAWLAAKWEGLALAVVFAAGLNLAIVKTFVWPEWPVESVPGMSSASAWLVVVVLWIGGLIWLWREAPSITSGHAAMKADPELEGWFRDAQHEYLKGHWIEAESLLSKVLGRRAGDVEGGLLLAAVQRQTVRWEEARTTLDRLMERTDAAAWRYEIETELRKITELENTSFSSTIQEGEEVKRRVA
jgi:hypothetical protein